MYNSGADETTLSLMSLLSLVHALAGKLLDRVKKKVSDIEFLHPPPKIPIEVRSKLMFFWLIWPVEPPKSEKKTFCALRHPKKRVVMEYHF